MRRSRTRWALTAVAPLLPILAACGSADDGDTAPVVPVGSCAAFALDYVATQKLSMPELEHTGWRIAAAAAGDTEIRVLLEQRAVDVTELPKLVRYDMLTKERLGEIRVALATDSCPLLGLTMSPGAWVVLSGCSGTSGQTQTVDSVAEDGSTGLLFSVIEPRAVRLAFDEDDGQYWIWSFDGVFSASAADVPVFAAAGLEPLGWGPTSGFDHVGSTLVFARDASEAGMSNMLALQSDTGGERCKFEIENAPGLGGQKGVLAFGDASALWALSPRGDLAEFRLSVAFAPGN